MGSLDSNASFRRKLSKREKKQLKKQEKLSRMKSENLDVNGDNVAEKLYTGILIIPITLKIVLTFFFWFRTSWNVIHQVDIKPWSCDEAETSTETRKETAAV